MDRIAVTGCGGCGKSHLARELGALLGITPIHLDGLYYDRDWKPLDRQRFAALQRELVSASRWIIDGNYASTLPIRLEVVVLRGRRAVRRYLADVAAAASTAGVAAAGEAA